MVSEEEIARAHREFQTKFKPAEDKKTADELEAVLSTDMKIKVGEGDEAFEFYVTTLIPPKLMRLITSSTNMDTENFDYDSFIEPFAEFMEGVCLDKSMDKKFWIDYDYNTGYLPDIVSYIASHSERASPKIESFR